MLRVFRWTAAWAALFLIPLAWTQASMQRPKPDRIELTGGTGKNAWRIVYGSPSSADARFVVLEKNRAWFSHGYWLRLLDTEKGTVLGRWRLPGVVLKITPQGDKAEVEVDLGKQGDREFHEKLTFDPAAPKVPEWPMNWFLPIRVSRTEAAGVGSQPMAEVLNPKTKLNSEITSKEIPAFEKAIERDPFNPWFRVALARMLRASGDARADAVLRQAVEIPGTDFHELLPIAAFLDSTQESEGARLAFDRGYRDFIQRGYDPRLMFVLIGRLLLYTPVSATGEQRAEIMERIYRVAPGAEGATYAWAAYAEEAAREGKNEEAQRWRTRAGASQQMLAPFDPSSGFGLMTDRALLAIMGFVIAVPAYIVVLYRRYRPQRRKDRAGSRSSKLGFTNLQYWTRSQRFGFLLLVLGGWMAVGVAGIYSQAIMNSATIPMGMGMGNFAGPVNVWHLETKFPASADRDLLLAMAYQHSGDVAKAEPIYRRLPDFAESWNNLGVILKNSGKEQEARQAFEQALKLEPDLAEASLNLGRPASDEWTRIHQQYVPGSPMLATPRRHHLDHAFLGSTRDQVWMRALAGPFAGSNVGELFSLTTDAALTESSGVARVVLVALMILALALLFLIPRRDVSEPSGPRHWILEVLFPGTAPQWSVLGGLVLLVWCYLLVQGLLTWRIGSPYLMTTIAFPNISRSYLVEPMGVDFFAMINPGWKMLYLAPAVLFLVNLVMVRRGRDVRT